MAEPITPVLAKWDHERQAWIWGLDAATFDRVQRGYGCIRCLEPFDFWVAKCYVCGEPNQTSVAESPPEWIGR